MSKIMDGREISNTILNRIKKDILDKIDKGLRRPSLAVIYVGNDKGSLAYIKMIKRKSEKIGIDCNIHKFHSDITEEKLLNEMDKLNKDSLVDGILLQLPLPKKFNHNLIISNINPNKDVDGVHYSNAGKLYQGDEVIIPCTPKGIMRLLEEYKVEIESKNVVVIGRSNILGKPISMLMLNRNATVTMCHSKTKNLRNVTMNADVIISCVGKVRLIEKDMVKEGSIIIDAGINDVDGKIVGDVNYDEVEQKASLITPVPGGVGPMTIAMLLENVMEGYSKNGTKTI
ncbi:bifunctional 5,10-methylenetetrahydrofolate dehydrogenase/5,10-methenyltetrahydrofolate cyclohydrolase [Anaeromonas gelatinilytica]|uniref:bifunctional 5,10-methylenetetrahydrofolate dehydrogenase/5,10-methenyltetrahydrofolate cyclohydrolase n=1 Tax=Anaeromonas gelatinilytica TaxID=2683194 RepID=UPI001A9CAA01|nr:bifunctional 5,10-methylenetetrahydrofolate dehydrogenase/5,10-methenyltetrahydrofolate cyclohydrolase [Anaeromonas gelatinilytica]